MMRFGHAAAVGVILAALSGAAAPTGGERLQLRNLDVQPAQPRFAIPAERTWPATPGDAEVCIWADDKLAAASITIDDNWTPDHDWWVALGEKTGFRFTWFVITDGIGTAGFRGTWEAWGKLREKGHDVQSHTVTHLHGELDIEAEYRDSQATIEKSLPGDEVVVLAYPGGKSTVTNDSAVAAKYYIAARGTTGAPNPVNRTSYLRTNSASINKEMVDRILDREQLKRGIYGSYRGWLCSHYHGVNFGKTEEEKKASAAKVEQEMLYLKSREADVWVGLFREVVLYGQERDTAKLTVSAATDKEVRLTLTDDMDDTLFAFPLTVKVRLPEGWASVAAEQAGKSIGTAVVEHDGARYALVKAVPDKGDVVLKPTPTP